MIQFDTLGHISIVVDDIEEATEFYRELFGAVPIRIFRILGIAGSQNQPGF